MSDSQQLPHSPHSHAQSLVVVEVPNAQSLSLDALHGVSHFVLKFYYIE